MSNRRRPLFNPRAYATYPQVPPYLINAHAPVVEPDLSMTKPHDWSGFDQTFHPQRAAAATQAPMRPDRLTGAPKDAQGGVVQGLLDRAAGTPVTGPGSVPQGYGSGSVRFDKTPPGASVTIKDAQGNEIGVGRANPFDVATARKNLVEQMPNVGISGTPENTAFVNYAKKNGEQAAHEHLYDSDVLGPFLAKNMGNPTESGAGSINAGATGGEGSPEYAAGLAALNKQKNERSGIVGAVSKLTPGNVANAAGNAVASGAKAVGFSQNQADSAGDYVRNAPAKAVNEFANNPSGPVQVAKNAVDRATDAATGGGAVVQQAAQPGIAPLPSAGTRAQELLAGAPPRQLFVPTAPPPAANVAANPPPEDDSVPNYADGLLATAGDKIADFMDPQDQAFRAGLHGLAQPSQFTAAGPRSLELRAGATPKLFTPSAPSPDRSAIASAGAIPNYASGDYPDYPEQQQPVQSTQPTGNMKAAVIAEKNDLAKAGFEDQARAAGTADASGTWSSQPGTPNQPPVMPGNPVPQPAPSQPAPHKLTAHDFDNQWPDPAGLRGRMGGVPSVMGAGGGGGAAHNYAAGRLFTPAIAREKAAIANGVGGAKPTDRPVPTVLPGAGPAVVNSGERLAPTSQGVAVLNRNQQKKAKMFVPSRN